MMPSTYTRCVIITGTPNFQGQNLVNMRFNCTKISGPRHEIMLREVLPELFIILPLPCSVSLNVTSLWTWPACYWYGRQTVAHTSARVSRWKADTLNTNLASNFRPFIDCRTQLFVLVNDFNVCPCSVYCWFSLLSLWQSWFLSSNVLYGLCC